MIIRLSGLLAIAGIIAATFAPAGAQTAMNNVAKKRVTVNYNCENLKVPVIYENTRKRVVITYAGKYWTLPQVASGSGVRYLGHGLEWWTKGPAGTLSSVQPGGTTGDRVLAKCVAGGAKPA